MRSPLIALLVFFAGAFCNAAADSRGVSLAPTHPTATDAFDPKESTALFVGIRRFTHDASLSDVPYAVDDAVDLAFVLALDERVRLVEPSRVLLALSGEPQKSESRRNLERLIAAGATLTGASQADVLNAVDQQARTARRNGVLIVALATHGVSYDGTQYLLAATSILRHRETTISESKIRDIAAQSEAARSLILVDACRERLTDDRRNGSPDRRSAAALTDAMTHVRGQGVLSAAAAGQYAYDDAERRNGVFTASVIDGLNCEGAADERGLVTLDALAEFVEKRVLAWIRKHRNISVARATLLSVDSAAKNMPLATCGRDGPRQVLLHDDFRDNRTGWYVATDPEAPAGFDRGAYFLGSKPSEWRFTTVHSRIDPTFDFQVAVSARRLRGGTEHHFALLWGLRDGKNFFFFSINAKGNITIGAMDEGFGDSFNDRSAVHACVRTDGAANRLRVAKAGERLQFFVNDVAVHEMDFRPLYGPGVGFAALDGPIVAEFDDLIVEGTPRHLR